MLCQSFINLSVDDGPWSPCPNEALESGRVLILGDDVVAATYLCEAHAALFGLIAEEIAARSVERAR